MVFYCTYHIGVSCSNEGERGFCVDKSLDELLVSSSEFVKGILS